MSYFVFSSGWRETLGNVSFVYEGICIYKYYYYYYYTQNDNLAVPDRKPPNVSSVYEGICIHKYYYYYYYTHNDNLADPDKKPPNVFSRNYINKEMNNLIRLTVYVQACINAKIKCSYIIMTSNLRCRYPDWCHIISFFHCVSIQIIPQIVWTLSVENTG